MRAKSVREQEEIMKNVSVQLNNCLELGCGFAAAIAVFISIPQNIVL